MTLHSSATSAGDPTKFGTGRGVRFHTKTWKPRLRRFSATRRPIIPSPIKPTFLRLRRDILSRASRARPVMHEQTQFQNHGARNAELPLHLAARFSTAVRRAAFCKWRENRGPCFLERHLPWRLSLGQAHKMKAKRGANHLWEFR